MTSRAWAEIFAAIAVMIGGVWGARVAGRAAIKAADTTREVGLATVEATREDLFIKNLEIRLEKTDREMQQRREAEEDLRRRVVALEDKLREQAYELREQRNLFRLSVSYLRLLRQSWGAPVPPQPPVELSEYLSNDPEGDDANT